MYSVIKVLAYISTMLIGNFLPFYMGHDSTSIDNQEEDWDSRCVNKQSGRIVGKVTTDSFIPEGSKTLLVTKGPCFFFFTYTLLATPYQLRSGMIIKEYCIQNNASEKSVEKCLLAPLCIRSSVSECNSAS